MENVRRLCDLVDGNVEHVMALTLLAKSPQWAPIITFLTENTINSPKKILAIRKLLQVFNECDNDVALKKKYLQYRVQRASAQKLKSSENNMQETLEEKRLTIINALEKSNERLRNLKMELRRKREQNHAMESLQIQVNNISSSLENLNASLDDHFSNDLPICLSPCKVEDVPMISAGLLATVKNNVFNGSADFSELNSPSGEILQCMSQIYFEIDTQLAQYDPITNINPDKISGLRNLQQVTLELAKILIISKSDLKGAKDRLDALKSSHCEDEDIPAGSDLDISQVKDLISQGGNLTLERKSLETKLAISSDELSTLSNNILNLSSSIPRIISSAQENILAITEPIQNYMEIESNPVDLYGITTKHAVINTRLPHTRQLLDIIDRSDAQLLARLAFVHDKVTPMKESFINQINSLNLECQGHETLHREDIRQLIMSIYSDK